MSLKFHSVIIDNREKRAFNGYENLFIRNKIEYQYDKLPIGDFLFIVEDLSTHNKYVVDMIIERKTFRDFEESCRDNRYSEQKCFMLYSHFNHRAFLFEKSACSGKFFISQAQHKLRLNGFDVVNTNNTEETAEKIINIAVALKAKMNCNILRYNGVNMLYKTYHLYFWRKKQLYQNIRKVNYWSGKQNVEQCIVLCYHIESIDELVQNVDNDKQRMYLGLKNS
eukprot:601285_1